MTLRFEPDQWALILGGSSGLGLATAQKLARHGMNILVVHRDRRGAMPAIEEKFSTIRETGVRFVAVNADALSNEGRRTILDAMEQAMRGRGCLRLLLHSIAFGNLKLLAPLPGDTDVAVMRTRALLAEHLGVSTDTVSKAVDAVLAATGGASALAALASPPTYDETTFLDEEDFARTVHSMGTSLATWVQDVFRLGLFAPDARVIGLTSEGNERAWRGYAAVAAAKAAMESVSRAIAVEFGPYGVRSNIVQAGITDTPALRLIPGSTQMKTAARARNPLGRLTTAADIADFICLLCTDEAHWINGALLRVDGGEHIGG